MANKTYIVTGGAGFVGSHLCEHLAKDPSNTVHSVDNYFTGSTLNHVPGVIYHQFETKDIFLNTYKLPTNTDVIFHLGEYSRVEQSFDEINLVHTMNVVGTQKVLEFARTTGAKLVYAGSSTKFANSSDGYVMSPYAWTKAKNTELVMKYGEWYGLDYAITYFYNVYGPREIATGKYATLIAKFIEKKRKGETLTVVSPGSQQRNFTHVDDIVSGLILVSEKGSGDEYGIGHPKPYTVLQVAELFASDIEMLPPRQGNRMSAFVATERTRLLGWEPKKNLEDYISNILESM